MPPYSLRNLRMTYRIIGCVAGEFIFPKFVTNPGPTRHRELNIQQEMQIEVRISLCVAIMDCSASDRDSQPGPLEAKDPRPCQSQAYTCHVLLYSLVALGRGSWPTSAHSREFRN